MAQPHALEDCFRLHDEAFYFWLGGLTVSYGDLAGVQRDNFPILRVMASPDRAWAQTLTMLVKQGWISEVNAAKMREKANDFAVLPLPIVSIVRGDPQAYLEGGGVPKRFRRQRFLPDTQQWEEHAWPGSYRTEYRATFWSSKQYTAVFMREWIMAQLGKLGAGEAEVFIPVQHKAPWGPLKQALHFDSMTDASNLEGEEARYLRFEASFTLNTLAFRPPTVTYDYADTVAMQHAEVLDPSTDDSVDLGEDMVPAVASDNLYAPYYPPPLIPTRWPKAGVSTVANSTQTPDDVADPGALVVSVAQPEDQVDITNRPVLLVGGEALLSIAFQYKSDAAIDLDLQQHDGSNPETPVWTRVAKWTLPARPGWTRVHMFGRVTQPIFDLALIGTGVLAHTRIARTSVRRLIAGTQADPTTSSVVGATKYTWSGLAAVPHLVVFAITPTGATGNITVEDDDTAPSYSKVFSVSDSLHHSFVALVQPHSTTLAVTVATALTIADAYAQRYDGGYGGHDL